MRYFIDVLDSYSGIITILFAIFGGLWAVLKFREHLTDKRFKIYHDLIDQLVNETRNPDRIIKLDRQVAIIFELRNFTNYYPVTKRILTDLKDQWKEQIRVVKEIDITLDFISRNRIMRTYWKLFHK